MVQEPTAESPDGLLNPFDSRETSALFLVHFLQRGFQHMSRYVQVWMCFLPRRFVARPPVATAGL